VRPAAFWTRFAGFFLDMLITFLPVWAIGVIALVAADSWSFVGWTGPVWAAAFVGYSTVLEASSRRATVGKRAVGVVVTDLSGGRLSVGRALVRAVAKVGPLAGLAQLSVALPFPGSLGIAVLAYSGFLVALVTPRNRALHDLVAATVVLDIRGSS